MTKKNLPSYTCNFCRTRIFVNTQSGMDAITFWTGKLAEYKDEILKLMTDRVGGKVAVSPVVDIPREVPNGVGHVPEPASPKERTG